MYTFSSSPASQTNSFGIYGCGGGQNYMNWCNAKATALARKAVLTPDPAKRNPLMDQLAKIAADDINSIPMWSPPEYLIGSHEGQGPRRESDTAGPDVEREHLVGGRLGVPATSFNVRSPLASTAPASTAGAVLGRSGVTL